MLTWIITAIMTLSPGLLLAHPGDHAHADLAHFMSSPWHVPGLVVLAVSLVVLTRRGFVSRATARKQEHDNASR